MSYILEALTRKEESSKPLDIPDIKAIYTGQQREIERDNKSLWSYAVWALMFLLTTALLVVGYQWVSLSKKSALAVVAAKVPEEQALSLVEKKNIVNVSGKNEKEQVVAPASLFKQKEGELAGLSEASNRFHSDSAQSKPSEFNPEPPHLFNLPKDIQDALGQIEIKGHFYSTDPLRSAILAKEGYFYVGEEIKAGLILTEVTPMGAYFRYGSHEFQIAVLQNWLY